MPFITHEEFVERYVTARGKGAGTRIRYGSEDWSVALFKRKTGISLLDYYSSMVGKHNCPNCGAIVEAWSGPLSGWNKFCSESCSNSYKVKTRWSKNRELELSRTSDGRKYMTELWENDDGSVRDKFSKSAKRQWESDKGSLSKSVLNNPYKNKVVDGELILYCVKLTDTTVKIGCTSKMERVHSYKSEVMFIRVVDGSVGFKLEQDLLINTSHLKADSNLINGSTEVRHISVIDTKVFKDTFGAN